ncbi:bifunctional phosphopantothenoylcysteine decarboxylase/phosphopantothenate synthase [Arthrobacter pigmenti]
MRIILGVGGGIAAYKSASLLRLFTEAGHTVMVIPTRAADEFVGRATWEALSGHKVPDGIFDEVDQVNHVRLGQEADLIVVAPATADLMARAAAGMADDLLTNTLLVAACPVFMAPAMHTEMWTNPATRDNVEKLRNRGITVMEPDSGRLTGTDSGPGRLPEPEAIHAAALRLVDAPPRPLAGKRVVITAGGTLEALDPVRFLGNRSSGKQGVSLAKAAAQAGADVHFIAARMDVPPPTGIRLTNVESALELREATLAATAAADVVIMAAAVADFRPAELAGSKIKKRDDGDDPVIKLVRNPDILAELVTQRNDGRLPRSTVIIGFAAETGDEESDVLSYARAKLEKKGCDLLVLNEVGEGMVFAQDESSVQILSRSTGDVEHATGSKDDVAAAVIARAAGELDGS